jgi:hypothetical protein
MYELPAKQLLTGIPRKEDRYLELDVLASRFDVSPIFDKFACDVA